MVDVLIIKAADEGVNINYRRSHTAQGTPIEFEGMTIAEWYYAFVTLETNINNRSNLTKYSRIVKDIAEDNRAKDVYINDPGQAGPEQILPMSIDVNFTMPTTRQITDSV